ncbi:MAG: tyrosine-type recombinase/integrase [Bacteroidota bacterium]
MLYDTTVKSLKPKNKIYRVKDGQVKGLSIEVRPNGSKLWRFRFKKQDGKSSMLSLGRYPSVSISQARDRANNKRALLSQGVDISRGSKNKFLDVFKEWHANNLNKWSEHYSINVYRRIEKYILPFIGSMNVSEINGISILNALRIIEKKGHNDTAHRTLQYITQVFAYAISLSLCERNPAVDIKGALQPHIVKSYPAPTDLKVIAEILKAIDMYCSSFTVRQALTFTSLTMLRPGEVRWSKWQYVDWDQQILTIPGEKMKTYKHNNNKQDHVVPLSAQALNVLEDMYRLTGDKKHIFKSERSSERPISENTMGTALRSMGFAKTVIVPHSFRKISSTLLNERDWPSAWIEKQLAHTDTNKIRGIYNKAEYLEQRRRMLQALADFVDHLKNEKPDINKLRKGM